MAKKTWVKLKRGLLIDPKHRMALGNRIWLYLYMLDIADWGTGKVIEWRDRDAADELQMPLARVRAQRREIEKADYISCFQHHDHQTITIKKWVNPREYSGKVYNIDEGVENYTPQEDEEISEGLGEGLGEGAGKGAGKGIEKSTLLHCIHRSQTTDQYTNGEVDLFDACQTIYKTKIGYPVTDVASFALMIKNFIANDVISEDYSSAIEAMQADPKYRRANKPTSFERYAIGIADKRLNPVKLNAPLKRTQTYTDAYGNKVELEV